MSEKDGNDGEINLGEITDEEFIEVIKQALLDKSINKEELKSNVIDIFTKEPVDSEYKQFVIEKNRNFERMLDEAAAFIPPPIDGVLITISEKGSMHVLNTFGNMKETIHMLEVAKLRLLQSNG